MLDEFRADLTKKVLIKEKSVPQDARVHWSVFALNRPRGHQCLSPSPEFRCGTRPCPLFEAKPWKGEEGDGATQSDSVGPDSPGEKGEW